MILRTKLLTACVLMLAANTGQAQSLSSKLSAGLQERLAPTNSSAASLMTPAKTGRVGAAKIERPEPNLTIAEVVVPPVPTPRDKEVRPRISPERSPLAAWFAEPITPHEVAFADAPLAKQQGVDVQSVPPLPILGNYVKDRVSLADPSWEVSGFLILSPQSPERLNSVPFSAWNLPDPFENAVVIRLREVWAETPDLPRFIVPPTRP